MREQRFPAFAGNLWLRGHEKSCGSRRLSIRIHGFNRSLRFKSRGTPMLKLQLRLFIVNFSMFFLGSGPQSFATGNFQGSCTGKNTAWIRSGAPDWGSHHAARQDREKCLWNESKKCPSNRSFCVHARSQACYFSHYVGSTNVYNCQASAWFECVDKRPENCTE